MKHYRVLQYDNVDDLAKAIELAINDSWELTGQMFVTPPTMEKGSLYNQPITKVTREEWKGWKDCVTPNCNEPTYIGSNYCEAHKPDLSDEDYPIG